MSADRGPERVSSIARVDFDNPADFDLWQGYLSHRGDTHCTDQGQWRRYFRELYEIPNYSYLYLSGDEVRGAVSLYHFRSPFMGNFLVTTPFFGYGGSPTSGTGSAV